VQSGHSIAEFLLKQKTDWDNGTLVYLGVKDELDLKKWIFRLEETKNKFEVFREPDIGNQITSIATVVDDEKIFKRLRLI